MYNIIVESNEATVVSEYTPIYGRKQEFQSEAVLEQNFINALKNQGYEHIHINSETELIENLRKQLEILNNYKFSDNEWNTFFTQNIASNNDGIVEKTRRIQEDHIQILKRDNGESKNIYLIDKNNIHNNSLQVLNQYKVASYDSISNSSGGKYDNRYDVTILVNGLPLVHCELKRRGVAIREAFNQIKRYNRDSFWAGCGLYEYIQIFVISNGTNTKYYSNTTRESHIKEVNNKKGSSKKTSNSYEFTSYWADGKNKIINDLDDFAKTFLAKHTILNILTKYCVFDTNNTLLVMRPYQIAATERILNKILVSSNYHQEGSIQAGGFIWHTTGSGKTLTSFKTAILASKMEYIDKVLFVVDRKDLDYQTMKEYDRFQKDAANSNKSVAVLTKQLEDPTKKIIITTIQKLGIFVKKNKNHPIFQSHIVMIFDECHRSQFGELHKDIVKNFKKFHLFGFTGTPIFKVNAGSNGAGGIRTTDQAFGEKLHTYTIIDAINDHNVLPFRIDYIKTIKMKNGVKDKKVEGIDKESALNSDERISAVVNYIIEHFDHKTKRNTNEKYIFNALTNIKENATAKDRNSVKEIKESRRLSGFNSMFCVQSIEMAIKYYKEFQKQISDNSNCNLKVGMIYSFGANEADDENGYVDDENSDDTNGLDVVSRDYLESAIKDYNQMFHTDYDTSSDKFQNYYKDVSLRMKNRELDLLIVVNMFLTGFDATTLNTLWVDKNLKMHGLIQAYSRTNRILNSIKTFGNIVCFRDLSEQTDSAIALFGDKDATGTVLLRSFDDYYNGFTDEKEKYHKGYTELVNELLTKFPIQDFVNNVITLEAKKEFVMLYGAILRMRNILSTFDQFEGDDTLSINDLQDYQSHYIDIHDELRPTDETQKENINDDIVFEMELIKQVDINIDYILMLVAKYHESNCKDSEIIVDIKKAIGGSIELRSKKQLIEDFIASINTSTDIQSDWQKYIQQKKIEELDLITKELKLKPEETKAFVDNSFRDGELRTTGTDIDKILPAVSRFGGGNRSEVKKNVIARLQEFFEKYFGV